LQICGNLRVLYAKQQDSTIAVARECRSVLQRSVRVRRKICRKKDVSERKHYGHYQNPQVQSSAFRLLFAAAS
jgi:hypothetical protein